MKKRLKTILDNFEGKKEEIIPILQDVQVEFSYLPEDAMLEVAKFTGVPSSRVYAVATFYAQFKFNPIGKNHVVVCRGTACHVRGAKRVLEEIERQLGIKEDQTSKDLKFSLETVACIGACGLSPCIVINGKVYAKMTFKKIAKVFKELKNQ